MTEIRHIDGGNWLTPEEVLSRRLKAGHKAVMIVAMDHDGAVTTYSSSGFSAAEAVYAASRLNYDVQQTLFE